MTLENPVLKLKLSSSKLKDTFINGFCLPIKDDKQIKNDKDFRAKHTFLDFVITNNKLYSKKNFVLNLHGKLGNL